MKKLLKLFPIIIAVFSLTFTSCDEFETLFLNIPVTFEFTATGTNDTYDSGNYCLDFESDTFQEYRDKIKDLNYLEAAYRTISISDPDLTVTLNVQVLNANGVVLMNFTIPNFKPSDYINTPYILAFDQSQIDALNAYFDGLNETCFRAIITMSGISGSQTVNGAVDVVFEAETEL